MKKVLPQIDDSWLFRQLNELQKRLEKEKKEPEKKEPDKNEN